MTRTNCAGGAIDAAVMAATLSGCERSGADSADAAARAGPGPHQWLLDVVAPDARTTANVIANFRQVAKDGALKLHPIIATLVNGETLKKMGAERQSGDATASADDAGKRQAQRDDRAIPNSERRLRAEWRSVRQC